MCLTSLFCFLTVLLKQFLAITNSSGIKRNPKKDRGGGGCRSGNYLLKNICYRVLLWLVENK